MSVTLWDSGVRTSAGFGLPRAQEFSFEHRAQEFEKQAPQQKWLQASQNLAGSRCMKLHAWGWGCMEPMNSPSAADRTKISNPLHVELEQSVPILEGCRTKISRHCINNRFFNRQLKTMCFHGICLPTRGTSRPENPHPVTPSQKPTDCRVLATNWSSVHWSHLCLRTQGGERQKTVEKDCAKLWQKTGIRHRFSAFP